MKLLVQERLVQLQPIYTLNKTTDDSLFGGNLGLVLLYHEWYRQSGEQAYLEKGRALLQDIFYRLDQDGSGINGPSLSKGCTGLAMLLSFFEKDRLIAMETRGARKKLDEFLFEAAMAQLENDFTDCLHGAFGIIHYFTRYGPKPYLNELVLKACSLVVKDPFGHWFPNAMLGIKGQNEINFSLSHGQCGMLLVLLAAINRSDHASLIEQTLREGIRFIAKHRLYVDSSNDEHSCYPLSIKENTTGIENLPRLGWCYGDLNAALLFYRAGKTFNDPSITQLGDIAGLHSVSRKDAASTQVTDSHFCHGSAGLAQFYKCLYNETGNTNYQDAYLYWIRKTTEFVRDDMNNGAFQQKEHSLLEGPVGVSLVLLAYLSGRYPAWSRILFL